MNIDYRRVLLRSKIDAENTSDVFFLLYKKNYHPKKVGSFSTLLN